MLLWAECSEVSACHFAYRMNWVRDRCRGINRTFRLSQLLHLSFVAFRRSAQGHLMCYLSFTLFAFFRDFMSIANTSVSVMPVACPFAYLSHLSSTSLLLSCSFFPLSFFLSNSLSLSLSISFLSLVLSLSVSIPSTLLSVEVRQEEGKSVFLSSKLFSLPSLCPFCVFD